MNRINLLEAQGNVVGIRSFQQSWIQTS